MAQDSNVTYQVVRRACKALLERHEKPSRPAVQELLATDEYLGHKGSNAVVQKLINEFWVEVTELVTAPPRVIEGMPAEYVSVIDKALIEMVNISRDATAKEVAEERAGLKAREAEMAAAVQDARDAAAAADQLRLRAEGERNALEQRLREQAAELALAKKDIQSGQERESLLTADVRERDVQIKHLDAAIAAGREAAEVAQSQHKAEVNRLLQQVDDARQSALKEAAAVKSLSTRVGALEQELATARAQLAAQGDQIGSLRSDIAQKAAVIEEKSNQIAVKDAEITSLNRRVLTMEVQVAAANQQRTAAEDRLSVQTEEVGRLRGRIEVLEKTRNEKSTSGAK